MPRGELERADGDVKGARGGSDAADGSAVEAPAGGFKLFDNLHGADFGGSGDGTARHQGAHDGGPVREGEVRASAVGEGGFNSGDGVPERGVHFEIARVADADGAVAGEAAEVVAEQIDNHGEFRLVFRGSEEFVAEGGVFCGVGEVARAGAFDGAGDEVVAVAVEEEFGGGGDGGLVIEEEKRGVGGGGFVHQLTENIDGGGVGAEVPALGEVGLEDIAGGNVLLDLPDFVEIVSARKRSQEFCRRDVGRRGGSTGTDEAVRHQIEAGVCRLRTVFPMGGNDGPGVGVVVEKVILVEKPPMEHGPAEVVDGVRADLFESASDVVGDLADPCGKGGVGEDGDGVESGLPLVEKRCGWGWKAGLRKVFGKMDLERGMLIGGGESDEGFAGEDALALVVSGVEDREGFVREAGEEVEKRWAGQRGAGALVKERLDEGCHGGMVMFFERFGDEAWGWREGEFIGGGWFW